MFAQKSLRLLKVLTVSLSPTILLFPSWSSQLRAQSFPQLVVSVQFPKGMDRGAPNRTAGAGSRGGCPSESAEAPVDSMPMTALMPENNVGTTVAPNPTVYVYVPKTQDKEAEFRVIDKQAEKVVYQSKFKLPNQTAIVKLSIPTAVELKTNTDYQWQFYIMCEPENQEQDQMVEGWLERTSLSSEIETKLQEAKQQPLKQAKLYADAGVWNETLNIHVQQRDSEPNEWIKLLDSVGLVGIAQTPIIDCSQN